MHLELSPNDAALLAQLVEARLGELGPELRRTEQMEFHDNLKVEKKALDKILHQLHEV